MTEYLSLQLGRSLGEHEVCMLRETLEGGACRANKEWANVMGGDPRATIARARRGGGTLAASFWRGSRAQCGGGADGDL